MADDSLLNQPVEAPDQAVEPSSEQPVDSDKLDFVLDKYRADGRSEQDSAYEQAKAYTELQKKFGSFTGAGALQISMVIEIDAEDPLLQAAQEMAKNSNMSQEGFNEMVNLYVNNQVEELKGVESSIENELKQLGTNAAQRINGVNQYIDANFDPETAHSIKAMATTAESVKAIGAMIGKTRNAPVAPVESVPMPTVTRAEIEAMQFEKDQFGGRKINSDPEFRKAYNEKLKQLYGDAEHKVMVG